MLLLLAAACSYTPTVAPHDVGIRDLTLEGATVDLAVQVHNPLPAAAQVDAGWRLLLDGTAVSEGTVHGLGVAPSADTVLHVPLALRWADLWAVAGTGGRPVPWRVELDLAGHTGLGTWSIPYAHDGELPALAWPDVTFVDWRIDRMDTSVVAATLMVDVARAPVHQLTWATHVGVVPLAHGRIERAVGPTELPVVLELGRSIEALKTLPVVGLGFTLDGRVDTPLGPIPVALDRRWAP
jgi:hypothetical protein